MAMDEALEKLAETVSGAAPGSVVGYWVSQGELTLTSLSPRAFDSAAASVSRLGISGRSCWCA